jgi:4-hydroxy-3-polyprenylbenzoate decarboxylase
MGYSSLEQCLLDLERHGQLVRIKEEVDPNLEMAAIHLRIHEAGGPAILFENVKGSPFRAASNIFGTIERSRFIFRDAIDDVKNLVRIKSDPIQALKHPINNASALWAGLKALPMKSIGSVPVKYGQTSIDQLPLIKHWPMDGGAFVTLPIVYTEDIDKPGIMNSNIGMYRIQLSGNEYELNKEIGLHYQLHRGIGVHQTKAAARGEKLKVSVVVGGPPALTFGAVMPLPEGMSELTFAGVLGQRRVRHTMQNGFRLLSDADFVITGEVLTGENKPEGPFGDHLGYYSLKHQFPVMKVQHVYHRKNAIWPFTVVGRPPQEDTSFGALVHELTGSAIPDQIPGLKAVHAVDGSGVHPLLLAIGSERYTPYLNDRKPAEILTIANHILGFGQLSLAKYLFICAHEDQPNLDIHDIEKFFTHILERIDFKRDLHFHTQTSIDTLDYSGTGLNSGSKVVFAAAGAQQRELLSGDSITWPDNIGKVRSVFPGVIAIQKNVFSDLKNAEQEMHLLADQIRSLNCKGIAMVVVCDDAEFTAANLHNWLWVTFTRSNPSHDIYGVNSRFVNKHWECESPVMIDARKKPHHAPELLKDAATENKIDRLFEPGASLHNWRNKL